MSNPTCNDDEHIITEDGVVAEGIVEEENYEVVVTISQIDENSPPTLKTVDNYDTTQQDFEEDTPPMGTHLLTTLIEKTLLEPDVMKPPLLSPALLFEKREASPIHNIFITPEKKEVDITEIGYRRTSSADAAIAFERGLVFISEKKLEDALREWEHAMELDPTNTTYKSNVKRLRAKLPEGYK